MQEQIKKIKIVLENCEIITIDGKYIGDFTIKNIQHSIERLTCNYIAQMDTCTHFSIQIHRDAALNQKMEFTMGKTNEKRNPLERINDTPDITAIYVYFEDDDCKPIYVPWSGNSEYYNEAQKTYINKFGDLYIVIDEKSKLEDVYDLEYIEDKEITDFTWSMYE